MKKNYDSIDIDYEDNSFPDIEVDYSEVPDSYEIEISLLKEIYKNEDYTAEEDNDLSDHIQEFLNKVFESYDKEVIDFDYNYTDDYIYVENILWS